jgi:hypothetical protein
MERMLSSMECGKHFEWQKWVDEIPYLQLPNHLKIKPIPPLNSAVVRFLVTDRNEKHSVSVYLDCYDELGIMGKPYWEIYPNEEGDTTRFWLDETKDLVEEIDKTILSYLAKESSGNG